MLQLEHELDKIRKLIIEQLELCLKQLGMARTSLMNLDKGTAQEVIHNEARVNAMELLIDKMCETTLVLRNPVASDMRLVLSVIKMNSELERIGDHAEGFAKYALEMESKFPADLVKKTKVNQMFETAYEMVHQISDAFKNEDAEKARGIFEKDHTLNTLNKKSSGIIADYIKVHPDHAQTAMYLFSTIRKLERIGDLTKNLSEDIIFFIEAEVLKHNPKKARMS